MIVKDLKEQYPKVYIAACANALSQGKSSLSSPFGLSITLMNAFYWVETPQGGSFWSDMYIGRIEEAKNRFPELFKSSLITTIEGIKEFSVVEEGLWSKPVKN